MAVAVAVLCGGSAGCGMDWRSYVGDVAKYCAGADAAPAALELAGLLLGDVVALLAGGQSFDGAAWKGAGQALGVRYGIDCLRYAGAHLLDDMAKCASPAKVAGPGVCACHGVPSAAGPFLRSLFRGGLAADLDRLRPVVPYLQPGRLKCQ